MENLNMDLLYMAAAVMMGTQFFIVMGLVDAIPMIAVGLGLYVMFAVA
ncbi:MAG: hypothetical protein E6307_14815 [Klebsiella pneumoniae]|nr:hypothetical protein [Klebsiella pneumoniae]